MSGKTTERIGFWLLVVVFLVPIWIVEYVPTEDGPMYVGNSVLIRDYHDPRWTAFREFYELDSSLVTNRAAHAILVTLGHVVPMRVAEKLLLSLYVIFLPGALRYAVIAVNPSAASFSFFGFPAVYNFFLVSGFYNFVCGLVLFLFTLGFWLKRRETTSLRKYAGLLFLGILLCLTHTVAFTITLITIILLEILSPTSSGSSRGRLVARARKLVWPLLAISPGVILLLVFLSHEAWVLGRLGLHPVRLSDLDDPFLLRPLISFDFAMRAVVWPFAFFLLGIALWLTAKKIHRGNWRPLDVLLALPLVYLGVYFAALFVLGNRVLAARISIYPVLVLPLWLAAQEWSPAAKRRLAALAAVAALALLGFNLYHFVRLDQNFRELMAISREIRPNSTIYAITFSNRGLDSEGRPLCDTPPVLRHYAGYIAAEKHCVFFDNHQADTSYFPIRYRAELNPFNVMQWRNDVPGENPESVDIRTFVARTGRPVDYVITWGLPEGADSGAYFQAVRRLLDAGFVQVDGSGKPGRARLLRSRETAPEAPRASQSSIR